MAGQELLRKVREEVLRSAAVLRPDELATSVESVIEHYLRNAQSEAVAVKPFMYGIRDLRDGTPHFDEFCVSMDRDDVEEQIEGDEGLEVVALYTHPAPPLAVTDEMVDGRKLLGAINKLPRRVIEVHDNNGDVFVSLHKLRAALTAALEAKPSVKASDTPFGHEYGEGMKLTDLVAALEAKQ